MAASRPPVQWRRFDVILLKSTATVLAAAMFVGDRTTASTPLAGAATASIFDWAARDGANCRRCRPGDAAEPRHVRVQRPLWLHPQAGLHESQRPPVRPVRRVHRRRHRRRHRARQGRKEIPVLPTTPVLRRKHICRLLPHIWTIILKLHLIDLLSVCYTSKFATNTVTYRTGYRKKGPRK